MVAVIAMLAAFDVVLVQKQVIEAHLQDALSISVFMSHKR